MKTGKTYRGKEPVRERERERMDKRRELQWLLSYWQFFDE
jgi:hypothetical protein